MNLTYNFKVQTSELRSSKIKSVSTDADFYLDKEEGWVDYEIELNTNEYSFKSELIEKEEFNTKTIFYTNTTNVFLTNIVVKDKPYNYQVISNLVFKGVEDVIKKTGIQDVVEFKGSYYTNSEIYQVDSENEFIYTQLTSSLDDFEISYDFDYISIETPPGFHITMKDLVIDPFLINEYSFSLPSFYIKNIKDNSKIRCVESNIKNFNFKTTIESLEYFNFECKTYLKGICNTRNKSFIEIQDQDLKFKSSSHVFSILSDTIYFKIEPDGSIEKSSIKDYHFKVNKIIDMDKVSIIDNSYVKEVTDTVDPSLYVNYLENEHEQLNNFGITYRKITDPLPKYHYFNQLGRNIYSVTSSLVPDRRLKQISMFEESSQLKNMTIRIEERPFKVLEGISYYIKEENEDVY